MRGGEFDSKNKVKVERDTKQRARTQKKNCNFSFLNCVKI